MNSARLPCTRDPKRRRCNGYHSWNLQALGIGRREDHVWLVWAFTSIETVASCPEPPPATGRSGDTRTTPGGPDSPGRTTLRVGSKARTVWKLRASCGPISPTVEHFGKGIDVKWIHGWLLGWWLRTVAIADRNLVGSSAATISANAVVVQHLLMRLSRIWIVNRRKPLTLDPR